MSKKYKHPPRSGEQRKVAEEVAQQQQIRNLKRKIALLKRLPKDFRDLVPGTIEWEALADASDRRKEMEAWAAGPVLCVGTLVDEDRRFFERAGHEIGYTTSMGLSHESWIPLVQAAGNGKYSWMYLPDEDKVFVSALNVLLSRFGYNVRARGQLMSERSGKPLGVVH